MSRSMKLRISGLCNKRFFWTQLIQAFCDRGVKATKLCLRKKYTWPHWPAMKEEIAMYIRSCPICQKTANVPKNHRVPLQDTLTFEDQFSMCWFMLSADRSVITSSDTIWVWPRQLTNWGNTECIIKGLDTVLWFTQLCGVASSHIHPIKHCDITVFKVSAVHGKRF